MRKIECSLHLKIGLLGHGPMEHLRVFSFLIVALFDGVLTSLSTMEALGIIMVLVFESKIRNTSTQLWIFVGIIIALILFLSASLYLLPWLTFISSKLEANIIIGVVWMLTLFYAAMHPHKTYSNQHSTTHTEIISHSYVIMHFFNLYEIFLESIIPWNGTPFKTKSFSLKFHLRK